MASFLRGKWNTVVRLLSSVPSTLASLLQRNIDFILKGIWGGGGSVDR